MWSTYKPVANNYFWVGIVLLMLAAAYGFWWLIANQNTGKQAAQDASAIILKATDTQPIE